MELFKQIFDQAILPGLITIVASSVTIMVTYATYKVSKFLKDRQLKDIAEGAVLYAEQVYRKSSGPEKLAQAKIQFVREANERGISISDDHIEFLIESIIGGINLGWKQVDNENELIEDEVSVVDQDDSVLSDGSTEAL